MDIIHLEVTRKRLILLAGLFTLAYALAMPDRANMLSNYGQLLTQQTHLITDFFAVAGLSATFLNASFHFFVAYLLMRHNTRSRINGLQVSAIGIFVGHSFFGTHILNITPLILGVILYAKLTKQSFKLFTTISMFTTALAPIVSFLFLQTGGTFFSFIIASSTGLFLGCIAPSLAEEFLKFHHGLTLYNYGFTTGIIALFFTLFLPYFKLEIPQSQSISTEYTPYLLIYLCIILVCLAILCKKIPVESFKQLLNSSGRTPDDFVSKFGTSATLMNMFVTTLSFAVLLLVLNVTFNGLVLGGLFTIMGFSAFGKHIKNTLPVAFGVLLACFLLGHSMNDTRLAVTILFATGLCPISGSYGMIYGIIAGFTHYNLAAVVIPLHQGMTLYNNGFSTGFVAAILTPIIESIQTIQKIWKKE